MTAEEIARMVSEGFDRAKGGDALQVYGAVCPHHDAGTLPLKSHYAFGWIIYYAMHQSGDRDVRARKEMLARYLRLRTPRPHKLHSMVLQEAIRLYKNVADMRSAARKGNGQVSIHESFSLIRFMALWQLPYLRPGDWRRKEHEGKMLSSTVEKLITQYVDEVVATKTAPSPEFNAVAEHALVTFPDAAMLKAQVAEFYIVGGEKDKAVTLLRDAVLLAPAKFFLWSRLAAVVGMQENVKLYIALLYKALAAPGQEQFKGKIRMQLAEAWLLLEAPGAAMWELEAVRALYTRNGWHLSGRFAALAARIPPVTVPQDPTAAYKRALPIVDTFLYSHLPDVEMRKTYHKTPTGTDRFSGRPQTLVAWRVTDAQGNHLWFNPARHGIDENLPAGTRLRVKAHNGRIVSVQLDA